MRVPTRSRTTVKLAAIHSHVTACIAMSADSISSLPPHIHDSTIIQQSARESIAQVCSNRLVSTSFCEPSSRLVKTLEPVSACDITSRTWGSFPLADGLRIDLCKGEEQPLRPLLVQDMLDSAPLGRLKRFALVSDGSQVQGNAASRRLLPSWSTWEERRSQEQQREEQRDRLKQNAAWSWHVAQALVSSASTRALQQVSISVAISTTAADTIICSLPDLQGLDVAIGIPTSVKGILWAPVAGKQLRTLKVMPLSVLQQASQELLMQQDSEASSGVTHAPWSCMCIDMRAVAQSTQLEVLHLGDLQAAGGRMYGEVRLEHWAAVAGLKQLQELSVCSDDYLPDISVLLQLPLLHTLAANWQGVDWELLAKLAALCSLHLPELQLLPGSSASSSIRELHIGDDMGLRLVERPRADLADQVLWEEVPLGLLARVMPALERCELHATLMCCQDLLRLLQGHSKLRSCSIGCELYGEKGWPEGGLLGSLASLEELRFLDGVAGLLDADVDALLQDAAGCGKLRVLGVHGAGHAEGRMRPEFTGQGLAWLADGLCSGTLEVCEVNVMDTPVPLATVAELLCRLPALRQGTFRVQWEGGVEVEGQAVTDEVARARAQYRLLLERLRAEGLQVEAVEEPIVSIQVCCATDTRFRDTVDMEDDNWCRTVEVAVRLGGAVLKLQLSEQLPGRPAWVVPEMGEMWELLPELPEPCHGHVSVE